MIIPPPDLFFNNFLFAMGTARILDSLHLQKLIRTGPVVRFNLYEKNRAGSQWEGENIEWSVGSSGPGHPIVVSFKDLLGAAF